MDSLVQTSHTRRAPPDDAASAWTIPLLCAGIAIIACCFLIPAADENRRLVYEREKLKLDLAHIEKQVSVNDEFLKRVADDPTLLERLAQRQMKLVRQGTSVLALRGDRGAAGARIASLRDSQDVSPYPLVTIPPPEPFAAYEPLGGTFSNLCRHPRSRLALMGSAMMLIASGLMLGYATRAR